MVTARHPTSALRLHVVTLAASLAALPLVTAAPASAQPAAAASGAPSDASIKKAVELFKKGQGLAKANKFADALPILRESYSLVASPNSQIYIARCLAGTGDPVAAYLEFEALIADVDARNDPKYQQTRDSAVLERDEIAAKIALVTVSVANATADTRVSLGLKELPREQWGKAVPFLPGTVEVSLTSPPAAPQTQRVELTAGQKRSVALDAGVGAGPTEPETPAPGKGIGGVLRPISYAAAGVGVLGMGMFAVAGALATTTYSDLEGKCSAGTGTRSCPPGTQGQIDEGKLQKDLANIGLIVGAAGLATGVTLFIVSLKTGNKDDAPPATVQPVAGPGYLGLHGTF